MKRIVNRIPRKKKKLYKKLWLERLNRKFHIVKSSIEYKYWSNENENKKWGCIIK